VHNKEPRTGRPVWARAGFFASQCPKSVITAQSLYFLEQFRFWKPCGGTNLWSLEAKSAEALLVLEQASQMENENGKIQE